jgi:hypothetical protein
LEQEFSQIETEEQAGFRAGRSTIDHVFSLKQLIDKKMSVDQPLHLLFVDLEKAYPPSWGFDVPLATALCKTFLLRILNDS